MFQFCKVLRLLGTLFIWQCFFVFFFSFWCATKKSFCRICLYSGRRWVQRWWLLPNIGSAILIEILRWEESGLYWMESIKRPDPLFMTITIINVKIMLITTITLEKQKTLEGGFIGWTVQFLILFSFVLLLWSLECVSLVHLKKYVPRFEDLELIFWRWTMLMLMVILM